MLEWSAARTAPPAIARAFPGRAAHSLHSRIQYQKRAGSPGRAPMKIYELPGQIRKAERIGALTAILVRYKIISTSQKLEAINPVALVSRLLGHNKKLPTKKPRARLIRKIIEELGTTYIKFGQWLSVRPDFVPPEVIAELENLQDRLPPFPFKTVKRTIEEELGKPIGQIFHKIDPQPLSTASIAQVHRGMLRTGEDVAVKVQHPNLKQ